MKRILFLAGLFFYSLAFCQKYHFDYAVQYTNTQAKKHISRQSAVDTSNSAYEMIFRVKHKKLFAEIIDYRNRVHHFFNLTDGAFPLRTEKFSYSHSVRFPPLPVSAEARSRFFSMEFIKSEDNFDFYHIFEFSDKSKKSKIGVATVKLLAADKNLFNAGLPLLLDFINVEGDIKLEKNYVLIDGSLDYDCKKQSVKLDYLEPQNFTLEISKPVYK